MVDGNGNGTDAPLPESKLEIVGIGASAGGVQALQRFFEALPPDTGAAFVVILHLDPAARSELPAILSARTRMHVVQVTKPAKLQPNCVYVIPPDRRLEITDDKISTAEFTEPRGQRAPIDLFFRSLAEHGDGFAIVMTGGGSDGALGVKAVKEAGGIILVQDPADAEHPSMPRNAIATGIADFVLPVREMSERLPQLIQVKQAAALPPDMTFDEEVLRRVLAYLRVRTGHDFSRYKRSTVLRRIARRMQVTRTNDLPAYYETLREQAGEAQALLADLLISVTTFFRDPDAFENLKRDVLPRLFETKQGGEGLRIWVAGCATGEEAYTLAILLLEEAARHELRPPLQVFASDLDARALAIAREGRFPAAIEADIGEDRLRRFFVREGDSYRIRQEVRDAVLFANHNLLKDPPFTRIDLISCRNLLIYLDRELQQEACTTFHYALNPDGYLLLGSSETADNPPGLFRCIDRNARIYQSSAQAGERPKMLPRLIGGLTVRDQAMQVGRPVTASVAVSEAAAHRLAIEAAAPPSVLVDSAHQVVHLSENAGRFFRPAGGPLSADIVDLVRPELRFELRSALNRALDHGLSTLSMPIPVRFNGAPHRVLIQVKPAGAAEDGGPQNALVLFIEGEAMEEADLTADEGASSGEIVRRLTEELEAAQSRLRTMREESETANEELRAANEELQSINEEYRSTAEELETSKEELQSINEELQTVNSELKLKLDAVSRAHSDLQNLMAATEIATLFLDPGLRIKRFTEGIIGLFNITPADEGRPITDFTHQFEYDLMKDARDVLANLVPVHQEIRSRNGNWFDVRLRPYRTVDNKIDGVVITFVDITEQKAMERKQQMLLNELAHRVRNTLSVVQSIARQTLRTSSNNAEFVSRFEGRLMALASAHALIIDSHWTRADLAVLARTQLAPHVSNDPERVRIAGEAVALPADIAMPFGLVLHELATNASKYGALAKPGGKVFVSWTVTPRKDNPLLSFEWREKDGPPVNRPDTHGLGSLLIERGIPNAKVKRDFLPDGLVCAIELPLPGENSAGALAEFDARNAGRA